VTDLPIIFSAPMVRALLREVDHPGTGKTMTRRLAWLESADRRTKEYTPRRSPWHRVKPGDRLWVREVVACGACAPSKPSHWASGFWRREQGSPENPSGLWYAADDLAPAKTISDRGRWIPPIHMPRWASRLTLIVTATKIERLQQISEADAIAEGCKGVRGPNPDFPDEWDPSPVEEFRELWQSLHGAESWNSNPEVVAITSKVCRTNIDAMPKEIAA